MALGRLQSGIVDHLCELKYLDGETQEFPQGGGAITRRVAQYYKEHVAEYLRTHRHLSLF